MVILKYYRLCGWEENIHIVFKVKRKLLNPLRCLFNIYMK